MSLSQKIVFVLGAGFTKAFVPDAPGMVDRYPIEPIVYKYKGFDMARRILETEWDENHNGMVNMERLMTRLDSLMPYDFRTGAVRELRLLLSDIIKCYVLEIEKATDQDKKGDAHSDDLKRFAQKCVDNYCTCITFNHDDVLDRALYEAEVKKDSGHVLPPYWSLEGGYGFFCRPSLMCIVNANFLMDLKSTLLLKLHGSTNWRIKRGAPRPYGTDAIVHHEKWFERVRFLKGISFEWAEMARKDPMGFNKVIETHLEPNPLIVPPILIKSVLTEHPILELVWTKAYEELKNADKVVFLGYSFPETDMAARFLFSEAIKKECQIEVVNVEEAKEGVKESYRKVFPEIADDKFNFGGVLEWSRGLNEGG